MDEEPCVSATTVPCTSDEPGLISPERTNPLPQLNRMQRPILKRLAEAKRPLAQAYLPHGRSPSRCAPEDTLFRLFMLGCIDTHDGLDDETEYSITAKGLQALKGST